MKRNAAPLFLFLALILLLSSCSPAVSTKDPLETQAQSTAASQEPLPTKPSGPDPTKDDEFNVLLIGNSYSYYWTDELWGLLNAAGYKNVSVCNVYYSGCTFDQHWEWYETKQSNYSFYTVTDGHTTVYDRITKNNVHLITCLNSKVWDVISLQQSNKWANSEAAHRLNSARHLPDLYGLLQSHSPNAIYFWQQNWAHEIGKGDMPSTSVQQKHVTVYRTVGKEFCKKYGFRLVPLGDAWELVRHDELFYKTESPVEEHYPTLSLHTRILHSGSNKGEISNTDNSHDGDVGGGQYLNACVWFECLTNQSCVGNGFRPRYAYKDTFLTLTEEQIAALQKAAHDTVASYYGEMPAA